MENKRNFIKRERATDKKIPSVKEPYRGLSVSWTNSTDENTNNKDKKALRKDEPFVLMFRNFVFFDVKSYECRNGDLYIRNLVDGIVLKRYFRMGSDDQLTVFKNRVEFDEFIDKVKEEGYHLGPGVRKQHLKVKRNRMSLQNCISDVKKEDSRSNIKHLLTQASDNFVLENYSARRDSVTGEIDLITSAWDGVSFTRDEAPGFFDKIVRVLEANPGSAQIFTKNDYM